MTEIMEDEEIVRLYFDRDQTAVSATAAKYGTMCRSISIRIVADPRDADECVSDTYLRTWNSIPPQDPKSLAAFVGRIVRNLSLDLYRRKNALKRSCECVSLDELSECVADTRGADEGSEISECINEFLAALPQEQRIYFVRRYYFGEPLAEIAERYGVSSGNLSVIMHRLRNKLKKHLAAAGIFSDKGVGV